MSDESPRPSPSTTAASPADPSRSDAGAERTAVLRLEVDGSSIPADLPRLSSYFSADELLAAHPEPPWGIYHSAEHTMLVRLMAFELARGARLDDSAARFVSEVALLHDWDPLRTLGTPARVPATLKAIGLDFVGKRQLTSPAGRRIPGSLLRARFGWGKLQVQMAFAMIYRTEFPFEGAHPNAFYRSCSAVQRYARCLHGLPTDSRAFVLEQAPILSQFADQTAWYATQPFEKALAVVQGLVNELNAARGPRTTTQELNTAGFLYSIGHERSFNADYRLAKAFGLSRFSLPTYDEAFALLPSWYGRTFAANKAAFAAYDGALAAGHAEPEAELLGRRIFRRSLAGDGP